MPCTKDRLLIVDDEPSIRESLSFVLAEIGYPVRAAEDGLSALMEMRKETPDMILSDLNMPGMSGFEFLSVVRHRFPAIPVIAMSGAFCGNEVPSGVAADAFYQKGSGVRSLLMIVESLAPPNRLNAQQPPPAPPVWFDQNESDADGMPYVSITCPECLRSFHHHAGSPQSPAQEAHCAHCRNPIHYAAAEPVDSAPAQAARRTRNTAKPAAQTQSLY